MINIKLTLKVGSAASSRSPEKLNVFHVLPLASAWGRIVDLHVRGLTHS